MATHTLGAVLFLVAAAVNLVAAVLPILKGRRLRVPFFVVSVLFVVIGLALAGANSTGGVP